MESEEGIREIILARTAEIVFVYVSENSIDVDAEPRLNSDVASKFSSLVVEKFEDKHPAKPAVSIRSPVKPDYIVCLEDDKKLKMLKRYLRTDYGMTPEDCRTRWNLPLDYPMVAPNYPESRRRLAKEYGLGQVLTSKSRRPKK